MLIRAVRVTGGRRLYATSAPLQAAADAAGAAGRKAEDYDKAVDPSNPQIAPTIIPWKNYKNEYYEKRGYTVANKEWTEWSDLPAPYKYLGVKVNPKHVEEHGGVWKYFSDWRTAVPTAALLSLPLWMFNFLPPFDERFELGLITLGAGWVAISNAGPFFRSWKRARVAAKVKALLEAEKELNSEIASSIDAFRAGTQVVDFMKAVHAGERSLRKLEAEAATKRTLIAQRDALVDQLDYLVALQASGKGAGDAAVLSAARSAVESTLEKDAGAQQKSIAAAIKALTDGSMSDDVVTPIYTKSLAAARTEAAAKPAARPLLDPAQVEVFKKRFGYVEDAVSEGTLARIGKDAAARAVLTGKVGGKAPAAGMPYVLKAPITYRKK